MLLAVDTSTTQMGLALHDGAQGWISRRLPQPSCWMMGRR